MFKDNCLGHVAKRKNSNLVLMILVTGGTGLVGSHLLYKLAKTSAAIRAIYRDESKLETVKHIFSYYSEDYINLFKRIEWIKTDITDIPKLTEAFKTVTKVYHCAALVSFKPKDYKALRQVNIHGTANIVNLCIANNIEKLCFVSSIATVGNASNNESITESCEWNKDEEYNDYAITKFGAEMEVWRGTQEGVNAIIVNPGVIIGPGFWNSSSSNLFKKVFDGIPYYTKAINGYVAVFDVVDAMLQLYNSDIKNQRYIVVSENIGLDSFLIKVSNTLGVKPPGKEVSKLMLSIVWRVDWLLSLFSSRDRKITKNLVKTLLTDRVYSSKKLQDAIKIKFTPISSAIEETSRFFLKDL